MTLWKCSECKYQEDASIEREEGNIRLGSWKYIPHPKLGMDKLLCPDCAKITVVV